MGKGGITKEQEGSKVQVNTCTVSKRLELKQSAVDSKASDDHYNISGMILHYVYFIFSTCYSKLIKKKKLTIKPLKTFKVNSSSLNDILFV